MSARSSAPAAQRGWRVKIKMRETRKRDSHHPDARVLDGYPAGWSASPNGWTGSHRSHAQLHLHVQSRVQYRSPHSDPISSRTHLGDGEERTFQISDPGENHATGIAGPRGSWES